MKCSIYLNRRVFIMELSVFFSCKKVPGAMHLQSILILYPVRTWAYGIVNKILKFRILRKWIWFSFSVEMHKIFKKGCELKSVWYVILTWKWCILDDDFHFFVGGIVWIFPPWSHWRLLLCSGLIPLKKKMIVNVLYDLHQIANVNFIF